MLPLEKHQAVWLNVPPLAAHWLWQYLLAHTIPVSHTISMFKGYCALTPPGANVLAPLPFGWSNTGDEGNKKDKTICHNVRRHESCQTEVEWMLWPNQTWKKLGKPCVSYIYQHALWKILPHGCKSEPCAKAPGSLLLWIVGTPWLGSCSAAVNRHCGGNRAGRCSDSMSHA